MPISEDDDVPMGGGEGSVIVIQGGVDDVIWSLSAEMMKQGAPPIDVVMGLANAMARIVGASHPDMLGKPTEEVIADTSKLFADLTRTNAEGFAKWKKRRAN